MLKFKIKLSFIQVTMVGSREPFDREGNIVIPEESDYSEATNSVISKGSPNRVWEFVEEFVNKTHQIQCEGYGMIGNFNNTQKAISFYYEVIEPYETTDWFVYNYFLGTIVNGIDLGGIKNANLFVWLADKFDLRDVGAQKVRNFFRAKYFERYSVHMIDVLFNMSGESFDDFHTIMKDFDALCYSTIGMENQEEICIAYDRGEQIFSLEDIEDILNTKLHWQLRDRTKNLPILLKYGYVDDVSDLTISMTRSDFGEALTANTNNLIQICEFGFDPRQTPNLLDAHTGHLRILLGLYKDNAKFMNIICKKQLMINYDPMYRYLIQGKGDLSSAVASVKEGMKGYRECIICYI